MSKQLCISEALFEGPALSCEHCGAPGATFMVGSIQDIDLGVGHAHAFEPAIIYCTKCLLEAVSSLVCMADEIEKRGTLMQDSDPQFSISSRFAADTRKKG